MKILILCTGNTCRSQMAEGILQSFSENIQVFSAGTLPSHNVNPYAIQVMQELGLDISKHHAKTIDLFLKDEWDYVITVCGGANEICPAFSGKVKNKIHMGFEDPADATGSEHEILEKFRKVRDEILIQFYEFYNKNLRKMTN